MEACTIKQIQHDKNNLTDGVGFCLFVVVAVWGFSVVCFLVLFFFF